MQLTSWKIILLTLMEGHKNVNLRKILYETLSIEFELMLWTEPECCPFNIWYLQRNFVYDFSRHVQAFHTVIAFDVNLCSIRVKFSNTRNDTFHNLTISYINLRLRICPMSKCVNTYNIDKTLKAIQYFASFCEFRAWKRTFQ